MNILGILGWHVALGRLDGDELCKCAVGPPRHHVVSALVKHIWNFAAGLSESERVGAVLFLAAIVDSESWCDEIETRVFGKDQVKQVRRIIAKLFDRQEGPLASVLQGGTLRKTQSTYQVTRAPVCNLRGPDFALLRVPARWLRPLKQYVAECARDRRDSDETGGADDNDDLFAAVANGHDGEDEESDDGVGDGSDAVHSLEGKVGGLLLT
jgi:hypothetical protein